MIETVPVIMQFKTQSLLNPFDKVAVHSYQLLRLGNTVREVPIFGKLMICSFMHQAALRLSAQVFKFSVIYQAQLSTIRAMVQYVGSSPLVVSVSAEGLVGEERVYAERVMVTNRLKIGMILKAEVV